MFGQVHLEHPFTGIHQAIASQDGRGFELSAQLKTVAKRYQFC